MWSYNNKIPKIHRVSQNETDDLVIEHTEGEFKINVKDIVNVKRKSDIHSIKSDPSYVGFLNIRDDQKLLISLRDIIAIYFSAGFAWVLITFMEGVFNSEAETWIPFLADDFFSLLSSYVIFTLIILLLGYRPFKSFIFPLFIYTFYSKFVVKDLLVIETIGNHFVFRGADDSKVLSHFNLNVENDFSSIEKQNKQRVLFYFYLSLLSLPSLLFFFLRIQVYNFTDYSFLVGTSALLALPIMFLGMVLMGIGLCLIFISPVIIIYLMIIPLSFPGWIVVNKLSGENKPIREVISKWFLWAKKVLTNGDNLGPGGAVVFACLFLLTILTAYNFTPGVYLLGIIPGLLISIILRKELNVIFQNPTRDELIHVFLGILFFYLLEGIILTPIQGWMHSIHPFWYEWFFDYILYIGIVSIIYFYSFIILHSLKAVFIKKK
jgi:hypothetical protein